jgi:transposase
MNLMSAEQWKRLDAVGRIERGDLSLGQAAQVLGLSKRQVRRLRGRVRAQGKEAIRHGNAGRCPSNRLGQEVRERVVELAKTKYVGFNDTHFSEKLREEEGIEASRPTVRRILRGAGIGAARKHRAAKHRRRRERKPQAGMMMLWDGSRHDWLEGRGPILCLMGAIEDATGEFLPGPHFLPQESAAGYLGVLKAIAEEKGLPWSVYQDRHSALHRNDDHWTLAEELRGEQDPTQVGRALRELGVEEIFALSPQAKGRVERLWGTAQDRLTSELRLAGVCTIEQANSVLERYRPHFNRRFAKPPRDAKPAWRAVRAGMDLSRICSLRYRATVGNDNAVRVGGRVFDIPPGPHRRSYAKVAVEVCQILDGSWRIYLDQELLATAVAEEICELRTLPRHKRSDAARAFRKAVHSMRST